MKINKNKGKVHPSPPSHSSPSSPSSLLKNLLPAAILALTVLLSDEDCEVLAYMITRSTKTAIPSSIRNQEDSKKKKGSKKPSHEHINHKGLFDCDCFDCYTSFWFRWDSSPNRERIHQVIEAFEDHLSHDDDQSSISKRIGKCKKKDKSARRPAVQPDDPKSGQAVTDSQVTVEVSASSSSLSSEMKGANGVLSNFVETEEIVVQSTAADNPKGLTKKVLPDVLGLLNSRLWNLWSPPNA